jgi:hypothetical protein
MADPVLINTFEPGIRLVTGGDLNRMIEEVNEAFSQTVSTGNIGEPGGVAGPLDGSSQIPSAQIPAPATFGAVDTTTAQSVAGVKTFSASPIVPAPSNGPDAANKNYVDAQISAITQGTVPQSSNPNIIYGTDGTGAEKTYPTNAVDGVVVADGSGKIPTSLLPPAQHDTAEAASEAAMLALSVTAPAICIRTDFTPPHMFYLHTDPASTLANWTDTGEFGGGAADPSVTVGLTAKNGVATSYMRSDAAPAIDQAIVPTWTGKHTFTNALDVTAGGLNASGTNAFLGKTTVNGVNAGLPGGGQFASLISANTTGAGQAAIAWFQSLAPAEQKWWDAFVGNGTFSLRTVSDDGQNNFTWLTTTRTGLAVTGIASDSGSGDWAHTGAFSTTGTHTVLPAGGNGVVITGTNSTGVPSIQATGAATDISLEIKAKGAGGVTIDSPTAITGNATVGGNAYIAGQLGSAANTSAPSPTNSGITIGGAPTWAMASFYDQALSANNRTMDMLFISGGLKFRFANDARNAFLDFLTISGGQASGVTGITTTSGSGAWAHTGAFSATAGVTAPNASATASVAGLVKQAAAQADSAATTVAGLVSDFNSLLAKLRTAGIMAT